METNKIKKVYLYGAGGHAKVIIDILQENGIIVVGIIDDNKGLTSLLEIPVIPIFKTGNPLIISIGNNVSRKKIVEKLGNVCYTQAISKKSVISEKSTQKEGSVIMQGAIIQSSTKIEKHVIINTGATIDHDCIIEDYVHIAPGVHLCGNVQVGEGTLIGVGSVVTPGIKIGKWSVIGAGSVIVNDIPDGVLAMGNPCKVVKMLSI